MSRAVKQGVFRDGNGAVVTTSRAGTVTVFLAGTTTPANIYAASAGGTAVHYVNTDASGRFKFYIDMGGIYAPTQKFDIVLSGTGINSQTYQDEIIFPSFIAEVTPEGFGAVGDGIIDDTAAIQAFVTYLNANTGITKAVMDGTYLVDYSTLATPFILMNIIRDDLEISGSGTIKAKAGSYGTGVVAGAPKTYYCMIGTGNRLTFKDITIDGNNQFKQTIYNPSVPFWWLWGAHINGTAGNLKTGGKIINMKYINGGGQAFVQSYTDGGLIEGNYAEHSIGIGFNGSKHGVLSNNRSYNASDDHFGAWFSQFINIQGNIADTNDNGHGIEVYCSSDINVTGNNIANNQNGGVQVTGNETTPTVSPSGENVSRRILINGNNLYNNSQNVLLTDRGEIRLGDLAAYTSGEVASQIIIGGNGNNITDDSSHVFINEGVSGVEIVGNTMEPFTPGADLRRIVMYKGDNIFVANNHTRTAASTWSDTFANTTGNISYSDPIRGNYFVVSSGIVKAGGAGIYSDIQPLSDTPRLICRVKFNNTYNSMVKLKVSVAPNRTFDYLEQEYILEGYAAGTVLIDALDRSLTGSYSGAGTITLTTDVTTVGQIDILASTSTGTDPGAFIGFELVGSQIEFYKMPNQ